MTRIHCYQEDCEANRNRLCTRGHIRIKLCLGHYECFSFLLRGIRDQEREEAERP